MRILAKFYSGKRVLVTGASGYIASALVPKLISLGANLVLSARSPKDEVLAAFPQGKNLEFVNLADEKSLLEAARSAEVLIHLAGQTSVNVAEKDAAADHAANVELPQRLLEAFAAGEKSSVRAAVFAGTATVVGLAKKLPVPDLTVPAPIAVYDRHKAELEGVVEQFARKNPCSAVVLRLANVYGPGKASGSKDRGILQKIAMAALKGQKITVFGSGEYIRDYVYIDDVADAFLLAALHGAKLSGKACFVCTGTGRSLLSAFSEVARQAEKLSGKSVEVVLNKDAPMHEIDRRNFAGLPTELKQQAGWEPKVEFTRGVALTLKEFC